MIPPPPSVAVQHNPKGSWTNTSNIGHLSHKSDCRGVHIPLPSQNAAPLGHL